MLKVNPKTSWNNAEIMPKVPASAYVDDSATLIGDVRIGEASLCGSMRIPAGGRGSSHYHRR